MASITALFERVEDFEEEKNELAKQGKSIKELIIELNTELDEYKTIRKKINSLKEKKIN